MIELVPQVILVGGFLGAGKTTLVAEIARRLADRKVRVGIVTNDQADDLVDTALLKFQGAQTDEVAGGCFCCRFDDFIARLRDLRTRHADVLIGEPVGSCTDLAATVVRPLQRIYLDLFRTSPYSVVVDPERWKQCAAPASSALAERALYIYRLQIAEADAIVLSKCDLLTLDQRDAIMADLSRAYPGRPIFPISSLTGDGIEALLQFVLSGSPAGKQHIDVDYDIYAAGEAELGWLNATVELTSLQHQDWADFCRRLLTRVQSEFSNTGLEIAHAKVLLAAGDQFVAGNATDSQSPPVVRGGISPLANDIGMTLNIRAIAAPEQMQSITMAAVTSTIASAARYRITRQAAFRPGRPEPTHRE